MQDSRGPVREVTGDFVSAAVSVDISISISISIAIAIAIAVTKEGGVFVGTVGVVKERHNGFFGTPRVSAEDGTELC